MGGGTSSGQSVTIMPSGPRTVTLRYKEYLGDVYTHPTTAGAFYINTYSINPGLVTSFPWLSGIAFQYEQWTPNGIVYEFRSTSSEYVSTQALGSVIMATEYDQLDTTFSSKQEMLNAAYSNEAKPSQQILHGIECARGDNPRTIYYVRPGVLTTVANIRDYDLGTFCVATQGGATANLNLGSLYVHYDITFRKETSRVPASISGGSSIWGLSTNTNLTVTNLFQDYGTNGWSNVSNGLNITLGNTAAGTANRVIFPPTISSGYFIIAHELVGTGMSAITNPSLNFVGMTKVNFSAGDWVAGMFGGNSGTTSFKSTWIVRVRIDAPNAYMTIGGDTVVGGTIQRHSLWVMNHSNWS
jgi:hypothetical protein